MVNGCLLYTSDAADERSSVDLGGRRIIKTKKTTKQKTKNEKTRRHNTLTHTNHNSHHHTLGLQSEDNTAR